MTINKEEPGRRSVEAEVDIEATPEQVWQAIATGPGVASWFMNMESEFDERVGGEIRARMGDQMVPVGKITAWDPPNHFASEGDNAYGPGTPKVGYEWTVEAKDGGSCRLRLVQTHFADDDAWDTQLGDAEAGWASFFHVLRNYVERHLGEPSAIVQGMGPVPGELDEAFTRLTSSLGIENVQLGARFECTTEGAPAFSGEIEDIVEGRNRRAMIRLESPHPGTAWVGVSPIAGNMTAIVSLYYYGEGAPEAGQRDNEAIASWLQKHGEAVTS